MNSPALPMPKSRSPTRLPKSPCIHGPTRRRGGRDPPLFASSFMAPYCLRVSPMKQSYQPQMWNRSEEHTSELQSRQYLVCRLLLEKKKKHTILQHIVYISYL